MNRQRVAVAAAHDDGTHDRVGWSLKNRVRPLDPLESSRRQQVELAHGYVTRRWMRVWLEIARAMSWSPWRASASAPAEPSSLNSELDSDTMHASIHRLDTMQVVDGARDRMIRSSAALLRRGGLVAAGI